MHSLKVRCSVRVHCWNVVVVLCNTCTRRWTSPTLSQKSACICHPCQYVPCLPQRHVHPLQQWPSISICKYFPAVYEGGGQLLMGYRLAHVPGLDAQKACYAV